MVFEVDVNEKNFQKEVIERSKDILVVVDFWAPWCGPCLALAPILRKLVRDRRYSGKFILAKINIEEERRLGTKYKVTSVPCVKIFKDGGVVDEFVGSLPESSVRAWLDKNLNKFKL